MKLSSFVGVLAAGLAYALPTQLETNDIAERADASLVGYLGVFFLGSEPNVYFYLSNGNNAISFKALNKGAKILDPTSGTGGVRDPSIISGAGSEAGKKWYIIGTDLDIGKVCELADIERHILMCLDHLGRISAKGLAQYLCLGEYRFDKLGDRKTYFSRECERWNGLGE